jgi:hypothetical protein
VQVDVSRARLHVMRLWMKKIGLTDGMTALSLSPLSRARSDGRELGIRAPMAAGKGAIEGGERGVLTRCGVLSRGGRRREHGGGRRRRLGFGRGKAAFFAEKKKGRGGAPIL